MKEYEISSNNKVLGKVSIYNDNIKKDFSNSLMESNKDMIYEKIDTKDYLTYEVNYTVNNVDDLFDIVSKYIYDNDEVFKTIEDIKKYNDIKCIRKGTSIKIYLPEIYLNKLNISRSDIDLNSLFLSKIHFIKSVISTLNINIAHDLNNIINEYNSYINSNEYEFYDDDERKENMSIYLKRVDKLIEVIESSTDFKYGKNYVIPIKISNN